MNHDFNAPREDANRDRAKDTGMALVLLSLLAAYYGQRRDFVLLAIILLVIDMIRPAVFHYPSKVWFGIAHLMGVVTSKVILLVLFYGMVTPIGVLQRLCGSDLMQKKCWKNGQTSVFRTRNHTYQAQDVERPY